jgi:hypothetical protein
VVTPLPELSELPLAAPSKETESSSIRNWATRITLEAQRTTVSPLRGLGFSMKFAPSSAVQSQVLICEFQMRGSLFLKGI